MMPKSQAPAPMSIGIPQSQPAAAPAAAPFAIGPEMKEAIQKIAGGLSGQGGMPGMPVDRNSPEYRQAMLQQLAATGPMGAVGSVLHQWGDARKAQQAQQQADMNAWMPTVTPGG